MEITLENVRAIVREAFEDFRENTFAPYCKKNDEDHAEIKHKQDATNSNVTKLQQWRAKMEGAAWALKHEWALIVGCSGVVSAVVGAILKWG